jgi:hypothetical protein
MVEEVDDKLSALPDDLLHSILCLDDGGAAAT